MNSKNLETLPEEIRSHILSLMPTKFAVQTSILSKSWRYSWTLVSNLDFDFDYDDLDKFVKRVFKSYKTCKLNLFRLHFGVKNPRNVVAVSNWIDEAVKLNVREVDIRVHDDDDDHHHHHLPLPLSIFTCTTLTMLRLDHVDSIWELEEEGVSLPCLKTLDIIVDSNPFLNAFKLIPGCPVLQTLSLQVDYYYSSCKQQQPPPHYIFTIPTLKTFKLTITNRIPGFHKVVLHLPILEYLSVAGWLSSLFVMKDLPALAHASISSQSASTSHLWLHLLKGISGVKSLTIANMLFDVRLPIFPNIKYLELKLFWDQGIIPQFLECCPELEHLCLGMKFALSIWIEEPKVVPGCIRTNLTTLEYSSCKETMKYDMKFLKYMLGNAEVLKTVTITCVRLNLEEEMWLYTELLKFPRASMDCAIKSGSSRFALLK